MNARKEFASAKREYVDRLFSKLLTNREEYFSGDRLNSDGRKLLEKALKALLTEHPCLRRIARAVRRDPSMENVAKLYRAFLEIASSEREL